MNAEIDDKGNLILRPLTQTEETALKAWQSQALVRNVDPSRAECDWYRGSRVVTLAFQPGTIGPRV